MTLIVDEHNQVINGHNRLMAFGDPKIPPPDDEEEDEFEEDRDEEDLEDELDEEE